MQVVKLELYHRATEAVVRSIISVLGTSFLEEAKNLNLGDQNILYSVPGKIISLDYSF